MHAPMR